MADVRLNVTGDGSAGAKAMNDAAGAIGKATVQWQEMANAAKKAASIVYDFAAQSVKKYAEAEKVQKQLTRAAGEYAGVLSDQADALEELLNVDGEVIKTSQTLLTQWGGVGAASEEVTRAILDYASATGKDAVTATEDLIRNVESGGTGLAKLGVHFTATGDKGKDLTSAVAALSKKFGGAAQADADSLFGQMAGLDIAFENLQEDIGQTITGFLEETGAVAKLTEGMKNLSEFITQNKTNALLDDGVKQAKLISAQYDLELRQQDLKAAKNDKSDPWIIEMFTKDVENAQAKVNELIGTTKSLVLPGTDSVGGSTNKAMKADAQAAKQHGDDMQKVYDENADKHRKLLKELDEMDDKALEKDRDDYAEELEMSAKRVEMDIKESAKRVEIRQKLLTDIEEANAKSVEKQVQEEKKARDAAAKELKKNEKERAEEAKKSADAIGAAFVNGLADQLSKLANGGEFDVATFVGDILATAFAAAATVVGSVYGMPALGAAIGNLGATGIRFGASQLSSANKKPKYHDGGWVGAPRYHDGGTIGSDEERAILQKGERVLSRKEVRSMGGESAIDKMANGGRPGVTIQISAIDAKSVAESFAGDSSRGLKRALRSGRGDLPKLFGGTPR